MINDYRFLIPSINEAEDWLDKYFKDCFETSDGSPFCYINEGYLLDSDQFESIPKYILSEILVYRLNERFEDKNDFVSQFWDGDTSDEDFEREL